MHGTPDLENAITEMKETIGDVISATNDHDFLIAFAKGVGFSLIELSKGIEVLHERLSVIENLLNPTAKRNEEV